MTVEILSPHYNAIREGNAMAIPASNLPQGYESPGFRISRTKQSGAGGGARR
jgi:hypothetical protein